MRIVQTFWTAGHDPLEHSFGWLRPEYNLMSWALSCLSLREHYDEVALFTDEQGKHILIDLLHLPYTEVNVVYDEHLCLSQHWAYAKIKTYSLQTKPFLHVDGDVFLPKPIPKDVIDAPVIVQNREIGTEYYRGMMVQLLREAAIKLPKYLDDGLKEEPMASCNMGIFGGSDLDFIHAYCEEAMDICDKNRAECPNGNFNLLFEQILLAYMARREKQPISTLFSKTFNDNGYTSNEFCLLYDYEHKGYFHLLGGHKRNKDITESLAEILLSHYPNYYKTAVLLFPHFHLRGVSNETFCIPIMMTEIPIQSYIEFLNEAEEEWSSISWDKMCDVAFRYVRSKVLSLHELDSGTTICLNPYMRCFDIPASWGDEVIQIMRKRLSAEADAPIKKVAVIPALFPRQWKEFVVYELEEQVMNLLRGNSMQVSEMLSELTLKSEEMQTLWHNEIRVLLNEGLIIINN